MFLTLQKSIDASWRMVCRDENLGGNQKLQRSGMVAWATVAAVERVRCGQIQDIIWK